MDLTIFFEEQQKLIRRTSLKNKRYLYEKIKWKDKCIAILGQRGVGKTTLMLQYLKEFYSNSSKALYIAADDIEIGFGNKITLWLFGFLY